MRISDHMHPNNSMIRPNHMPPELQNFIDQEFEKLHLEFKVKFELARQRLLAWTHTYLNLHSTPASIIKCLGWKGFSLIFSQFGNVHTYRFDQLSIFWITAPPDDCPGRNSTTSGCQSYSKDQNNTKKLATNTLQIVINNNAAHHNYMACIGCRIWMN